MSTGIPIADAVQAGFGLAQSVVGLINSGKAKREAEYLKQTRPKYTINPNVQSEVSLAQSELSNGMGAEAQTAYEQGIDRDLSTTLDALLKSGGSPNNIAQTFDASEQGRQKLAMMKDNLRLNQISSLVSAYRNQTGESDKAFLYNVDAPWKDAAQANAAARENANKMIWSGLGTFAGGAMSGGGSMQQQNSLGSLFSNQTTSNTLQPPPDLTTGKPQWMNDWQVGGNDYLLAPTG